MSDEWWDEFTRCRKAIQRPLSDKQIEALAAVELGLVKVGWGMTTKKPCPITDNTLWSLELRGLVKYSGSPGTVKLTPSGKQVLAWLE